MRILCKVILAFRTMAIPVSLFHSYVNVNESSITLPGYMTDICTYTICLMNTPRSEEINELNSQSQ